MPPQIALIISILFVIWLLRIDQKHAPKMSFTLWIPTIWMLLTAIKPLGVWFRIGPDEEGSPLDRVVLSGLLCLGLFILAQKRFRWSRAIKEHTWLVLLIGYMLVSILWSDIPYISLKRWIRELIAVVMAFLVLTERDPRQAVQSIFRRTIYILIPFSYILIQYFPEYGRQYGRWSGVLMWTGVASQKNGLALLCLFSAFFLVWTLIRRWQGRDIPVVKYQTPVELFLLFLTIWFFMGPQHTFKYSATSTAALAVGLTAFIGLLWLKKRGILIGSRSLTVIISIIIFYGTITPFVGHLSVFDVSSILGRSEALTGRTNVWAELLPVVERQPILGYGFGGFWTPKTRDFYEIGDAHSGYLDVLLEIGFVGMLLLAMFLLSSCRKAQKVMAQDFDWGALWICYLLMVVIHNIAESSINSFASHLTVVLLFLALSVPKNRDAIIFKERERK